MIYIDERQTNKLPGLTSLFIQFQYNAEIVNIMKICDAYYFDKKTKTWEVPLTNLALLLDRLCMFDEIQLNLLHEHKQIFKQYELNNYSFNPYKHQLDAVQYGLNTDNWLLLDDPGLGKTLSIILLAQELKQKENIEHCLVICGINTLKTNWKNEIKKFSNLSCKILGEKITKTGKFTIGSVADRVKDLKSNLDEFFIISNIETFRSKEIINAINKGPNEFDMIVIDEIHTCKTVSSQQGSNILKLKNAKYKIGLTGTLLTNSPLDCFAPLRWLGIEHSNQSTFKQYYCVLGGPFGHDILGYRNLDVLKNQLDTCSLRRQKDLLNLPEKTVIHEILDMDNSQTAFYKNIVNGVVQQVDKVNIDISSIFSCLIRLRQATACPSILTTEKIDSCKITRAIDLIEQVTSNNEKIVIFSTFKQTLFEIQEKINIPTLLCTGDLKDEQVNDAIMKFQNDNNYKVMLATWQKMGTGITLTAANYACFIDCPWTGAQCEQAEDRIHRIGSNKPVFIYYLWANDTIDLRVKEIVQDKTLLSDYVIDNKIQTNLKNKLVQLVLDLK